MSTLWTHETLLPPIAATHRVLLGEGQTPLVRSRSIGPALGLSRLFFKLENLNPTGSYKDRFAAVFAAELRSRGQNLCIATSSGNTGAALAAYSAAAGITCLIIVVDGAPLPKLRQMQLFGAQIFMLRAFGKDPAVTTAVFDRLEAWAAERGLPLPVSAYRYCPSAMQGVQTIAYELLDHPDGPPDHVFCPAGGGGLTLAVGRGAQVYGRHHGLTRPPAVHCVQPQGNDTIASALRENRAPVAVPAATTAVSGLQVPSVIDGPDVVATCRELGGTGYVVPDEAVFHWQRELARREGIFCEPAGAVALAGLADAVRRGEIGPDESAVCLVTGSGFKDMNSVEKTFALPAVPYLDDVGAMQKRIDSI